MRLQRRKMASGAPFAIRMRLPSTSTTTDMIRREKSNGISSILLTRAVDTVLCARTALSSRFLSPVWWCEL